MNYVIIIIVFLIFIIFLTLIYLLFIKKKKKKIFKKKKIIKQEEIKEEDIKEIKENKELQIGLFRYPKLVLNKNNINNPTDINPNACDKNLVMDYDEINLNSIKENVYDKFYDSIKQKTFNIKSEENDEIKKKTLTYVTTYINLPGYKGYNIEDTNRFELKKNNSGLINYVKLKNNDTFKANNSVIYP